MVNLPLRNWHADDDGTARGGKTVVYKVASLDEPNGNAIEDTTITDASGMWEFANVPPGVYDVYLYDGPTTKFWKGLAALPLVMTDLNIAADAGIQLSKLDDGAPDDTVTIATAVTDLQGTINRLAASIKRITGKASWLTAPDVSLANAYSHSNATNAMHGLPANVYPLGASAGGTGYYTKWGIVTTGTESSVGTPTVYYASIAHTFPVAFPTACDGVWLNCPGNNGVWCEAKSISAVGFTGFASATNTGWVASQALEYFALGH